MKLLKANRFRHQEVLTDDLAPITERRQRRWLSLIILCLGALMIVLDTTIVNVALPSIREALGFSETSLAWVVNAYLLTFGGFLLLGGRLGDLFGHRRLFLAGIMLFTLSSLACGLATTQGFLVTARAIQGLGGAVVSAVALSLIMTLFPEPAERAKAMGVFGFVAAGGGSIGVLLGGVLTNALNWHWIFLVNLPVGVAVVLLSRVLLPAGGGPAPAARLDIAGAVTVTASLILAVYAIVNGNQAGWTSGQTIGLLAAAAALLALFLSIEARVRAPLMPLGLFLLRNVATANVIGVLWTAAMFAWFFLSALPPARARLQPAAGRPRIPASQRDYGGILARPLGQAHHAVWDQVADRDWAAAGCGRPCPLRTGTSRRELRHRRTSRHDPARNRCRHGLQPGAAGRPE